MGERGGGLEGLDPTFAGWGITTTERKPLPQTRFSGFVSSRNWEIIPLTKQGFIYLEFALSASPPTPRISNLHPPMNQHHVLPHTGPGRTLLGHGRHPGFSKSVAIKTWYKNGEPRNMSRTRKAAAAISGWDCPLLTFIYPGLDYGSSTVKRPNLFPVAVHLPKSLKVKGEQSLSHSPRRKKRRRERENTHTKKNPGNKPAEIQQGDAAHACRLRLDGLSKGLQPNPCLKN